MRYSGPNRCSSRRIRPALSLISDPRNINNPRISLHMAIFHHLGTLLSRTKTSLDHLVGFRADQDTSLEALEALVVMACRLPVLLGLLVVTGTTALVQDGGSMGLLVDFRPRCQ